MNTCTKCMYIHSIYIFHIYIVTVCTTWQCIYDNVYMLRDNVYMLWIHNVTMYRCIVTVCMHNIYTLLRIYIVAYLNQFIYTLSRVWITKVLWPVHYRSLLQKSPVKETIFCKRKEQYAWLLFFNIIMTILHLHMGWLRSVGSIKL